MALRTRKAYRAAILAGCLAASGARASSSPGQDAKLDSYFAIWADNGQVTQETVDHLYAPRVVYYGQMMTREQVFRDKLAFIRRWPDRHYRIAPGSASKSCTTREDACTLTATLLWDARGPRGRRSGQSRIRLELERQDGSLTIARESGTALRR